MKRWFQTKIDNIVSGIMLRIIEDKMDKSIKIIREHEELKLKYRELENHEKLDTIQSQIDLINESKEVLSNLWIAFLS